MENTNNNDSLMLRHAWVNSVQTTILHHENESWADLVKVLTKFTTTTSREDELLFTGWRMKDHNHAVWSRSHYSRCKANTVALTFLVLDIDNQESKGLPYLSYEDALEDMRRRGYECVLYTSYNHKNPDKDGGVDKFRIVLPLNREVLRSEYDVRLESLHAEFPSAARESFTPSQPFYPPLQHPDRTHLSRADHLVGKLYDVKSLKPNFEPVIRPASTTPVVQSEEANNIFIRSAIGSKQTLSAADWYNRLQDGYSHKIPCFSYLRSEKNATCFLYKDGNYIIFYDMGLRKRVAIRVIKPSVQRASVALNLVKKGDK